MRVLWKNAPPLTTPLSTASQCECSSVVCLSGFQLSTIRQSSDCVAGTFSLSRPRTGLYASRSVTGGAGQTRITTEFDVACPAGGLFFPGPRNMHLKAPRRIGIVQHSRWKELVGSCGGRVKTEPLWRIQKPLEHRSPRPELQDNVSAVGARKWRSVPNDVPTRLGELWPVCGEQPEAPGCQRQSQRGHRSHASPSTTKVPRTSYRGPVHQRLQFGRKVAISDECRPAAPRRTILANWPTIRNKTHHPAPLPVVRRTPYGRQLKIGHWVARGSPVPVRSNHCAAHAVSCLRNWRDGI
jgi:hypothetical protein